jgi:hypothetical protein
MLERRRQFFVGRRSPFATIQKVFGTARFVVLFVCAEHNLREFIGDRPHFFASNICLCQSRVLLRCCRAR